MAMSMIMVCMTCYDVMNMIIIIVMMIFYDLMMMKMILFIIIIMMKIMKLFYYYYYVAEYGFYEDADYYDYYYKSWIWFVSKWLRWRLRFLLWILGWWL